MTTDLAALYVSHRAPLIRMLTALIGDAHTAEDVCQDVFVSMLCTSVEPGCGDEVVRGLYGIAFELGQQALDRRRALRLSPLAACQLVDDPTDRVLETSPEAAILHDLPPPWRAALLLQTLGFSRAETAVTLGCTVDDVRAYLFSARRRLQAHAPVAARRGRPPAAARDGTPPLKGPRR